jgi:hypothetical protein
MSLRRLWPVLFVLGAGGLAVYLWPAFSAPVVVWSDSAIDLAWARDGIGVTKAVPAPAPGTVLGHPPKPAYLLFLAVAMRLVPGVRAERSVVIIQSTLLWLSIAATSLYLARRTGAFAGIALYVLLLTLLRLRDSASAVMPEAFSAAIFLPLVTAVFRPAPKMLPVIGVAAGVAVLFFVRPNLAAIVGALGFASLLLHGRSRDAMALACVSTTLVLILWLATRPAAGPDPLRRLGHPILEGSAEYYWRPSLGPWPSAPSADGLARAELAEAAGNWKAWIIRSGPDARRERLWHALRGTFGTEYYDASWSPGYAAADDASRTVTPFLLMLVLALSVAALLMGDRRLGALMLLLFLLEIGENLVLGPNPRFLLPALPLFALGATMLLPGSTRQAAASLAIFVMAVAGFCALPFVLDREWGRVEKAGIVLRQTLPRGAVPRENPATLHIRIAAPLVPSAAGFRVYGPGARLLYTTEGDAHRDRPFVSIPVPDWLARQNAAAGSEITLESAGGYGPDSYLLFPVIPRPWMARAMREESAFLSPTTGIRSGSLDMWVHRGSP